MEHLRSRVDLRQERNGSPQLPDEQEWINHHVRVTLRGKMFEVLERGEVFDEEATAREEREKFWALSPWDRYWLLRGYMCMDKVHSPDDD